jgi:hypothetical protein
MHKYFIFKLLTSFTVSIVTQGSMTGDQFPANVNYEIFSLRRRIQTGAGAAQPPIQWVPEALIPGVKLPRREADHLAPSSAEVKNA